jgi:hypothetical protein
LKIRQREDERRLKIMHKIDEKRLKIRLKETGIGACKNMFCWFLIVGDINRGILP